MDQPGVESRAYPWMAFHGKTLLVFSAVGLLQGHSLLLLNLWGYFGVAIQFATGAGLIRKSRYGVFGVYVCCGMFLVGACAILGPLAAIGKLDLDVVSIVLSATTATWWGILGLYYLSKSAKGNPVKIEPSLNAPEQGQDVR